MTRQTQPRRADPIPVPPTQVFGDGLEAAVSFATTEHFTLQTARVATVSEANGRASIYLAALSSNLIALAFIGQMSRLGAAFYAFALILLPVLAFVGVVTFQRLVQSSIEDIAYAQRVARLRRSTSMSRPGSRSSCSWFAGHAPRLRCATSRFDRALGSSRLPRRAWSRS
jgi:hypothetical protein